MSATASRRRWGLAGVGRVLLTLAAGVLLVVLAALVAVRAGYVGGAPPADLGVRDGLLKPPSIAPNSVHSQVDRFPGHPQAEYARIAPLPAQGDAAATMARLAAAVEAMPGARIVTRQPDYLRVEFRTRWVGFIDDAEFWFDPAAQVVQLRSASRLGEDDFGVNRARIEALRAAWAAGG